MDRAKLTFQEKHKKIFSQVDFQTLQHTDFFQEMYAFPVSLPAFRTACAVTGTTYRLKILALIEVKTLKGHRLQETSLAQALTEDSTVTKD